MEDLVEDFLAEVVLEVDEHLAEVLLVIEVVVQEGLHDHHLWQQAHRELGSKARNQEWEGLLNQELQEDLD